VGKAAGIAGRVSAVVKRAQSLVEADHADSCNGGIWDVTARVGCRKLRKKVIMYSPEIPLGSADINYSLVLEFTVGISFFRMQRIFCNWYHLHIISFHSTRYP
jgi:hypothetical protein